MLHFLRLLKTPLQKYHSNTIEWYFGVFEWYLNGILMTFWIFCTVQWYFKLPLSVPMRHTEISLNGPMVLNDTEWYSVVYHWLFFVRVAL